MQRKGDRDEVSGNEGVELFPGKGDPRGRLRKQAGAFLAGSWLQARRRAREPRSQCLGRETTQGREDLGAPAGGRLEAMLSTWPRRQGGKTWEGGSLFPLLQFWVTRCSGQESEMTSVISASRCYACD